MNLLPITNLGDIAHVIQLAIAPVFLLTGVGTLLAVLSNRLGRAWTAAACSRTSCRDRPARRRLSRSAIRRRTGDLRA